MPSFESPRSCGGAARAGRCRASPRARRSRHSSPNVPSTKPGARNAFIGGVLIFAPYGDRADVLAVVEHLHRAFGRGVPARPADGVRELAVERDDRPVAAGAGAEPLDGRVAVAGGGVLLAARERAAHRPPVRFASSAATNVYSSGPFFEPKPPPMNSHTTRTLSSGISSVSATDVADAPDELRRDVDVERCRPSTRRSPGASPSSCGGRTACGTSPRRRRRPARAPCSTSPRS